MGLCKRVCVGCGQEHGSTTSYIICLSLYVETLRARLEAITTPIAEARAMPMSKGGPQEFREGFNEPRKT
jgi:hypothetical protein